MTDVFLYAGEPAPNDVRLRDPTAPASTSPVLVTAVALFAVYSAWAGLDQPAQQPRRLLPPSITAVAVDAPPPRAQSAAGPSYSSWYVETPAQQQRLGQAVFAVAPSVQPRPLTAINSALYAAWFEAQPPIQTRRLLSPAITAVAVDNPPPNRAGFAYAYPETPPAIQPRLGSPALLVAPAASFPVPLAAAVSPVYAAWAALDFAYTQPLRLLPPALTAVRVDNPPLLRAVWSGYGSWIQDPAAQQRAIQFVPAAPAASGQPVSNVGLSPVYAAWQLLELSYPQPRRLLPPSAIAVRVDNPPSSRLTALWPAWWNVETPAQQAPYRIVPQATADVPPGDRRLWIASVIAAWSVPDAPQQPRRILNPSILHVRVDNPPPRARNDVLAAYLSWDFPPQPIPKPRYIIPISGAAALFALPPYVAITPRLLYSAKFLAPYATVVPAQNYTAKLASPYATIVPQLLYASLAIGNNMPMAKDFPPIDAVLQKATCAYDFGSILPAGVVLTGSPTVTVTAHEGTDPTAQSRVTSGPSVGTQPILQGGTGLANTAVLVQLGTMIGGVTYLVVCSCNATNGDVMSGWNHVRCLTPA